MKTKNLTQKLNFYELVGMILGDGSLWYYPTKRVYGLEITGDAKDDQEYFSKLSELITKIAKKKPKIRIKKEKLGKSLKLELYSKKFVEYLINEVGITNKNKTMNAEIPKKYLNWKFSKHVIRGLFEADGSLYFSKSKKGKYPSYPRVEIKTSSKKLVSQLTSLLKQKAFKIQTRTNKINKTIGVYISGPKMLEKWIKEIGFSSMKKYSRYLIWKKFGYYIPRISYKKRLVLLCGGSQAAKWEGEKAFSG